MRADRQHENVPLPPSTTRRWLWALLLYCIASLMWLGRFDGTIRSRPDPARFPGMEPVASAASDFTHAMTNSVRDSPSNEAWFTVPFDVERMEQTDRYRFKIPPISGAVRATIQIIVECDHRYSYAHTYEHVALRDGAFTFEAPLTGDAAAAYWSPIAHPGVWSDRERSGLRRMEVKVFASSAVPDSLVCHYTALPADDRHGIRLAWATPLANPIPLGKRFELAFELAGWHGNPFDSEALPVALEVTPPDGVEKRIAPFLYQQFEALGGMEDERIRPRGPKHFRVRYRPNRTGEHVYRLLLQAADGTEQALVTGTLIVTAGTPPDFLRVSPRSPRFFEHADGRFFYAIGWNLPYPVDEPYGQAYVPYLPDGHSLAFMRKLLDDLADAGGNFARFWLSDWWNGLEWNRETDTYSGLGRYNLKNAWINDQVLEHCEQRGIYLQFETLNHVRLQPNYGWPDHPYSRKNGGFLDQPSQFWTHPLTTAFSRRRLAYIMARYADAPSIHSFAVMSEPDIGSGSSWPAARLWILSQLRVIQELDPYGRITVNQICIPNRDTAFFLEEPVRFVSSNAYPGIGGLSEDQIAAIRGFADRYAGHGKPVMIAEAAGHWAGDPDYKMRRDTLGAIWSGVASGLAGMPLSWWWNFNYGEDLGTWYRVVADFMQDEDLIEGDAPDYGGWRHREVSVTSRNGNLRALMVGNTVRRLIFAYNFDTLARTRGSHTHCDDNRIAFGGMRAGEYQAEYWDLHSGRTGHSEPLSIGQDGVATVYPPAFTEGWAIKIASRNTNDLPRTTGDACAEAAGATEGAAPAQPDRSSDWSWRIRPLVPIIAPEAMDRVVVEARIGLPEHLRHHVPRVTDPHGIPVPVFWESLEDGTGWHLIARAGTAPVLNVRAAVPDDNDRDERLDAHSLPRGLLLTVAPNRSAPLMTVGDFEQRSAALPDRMQGHVRIIDQVENPLGDNHHFLSVYQGPLLAPVDGDYSFATNSDDGSFVKINGTVVAAWPGAHDMEVQGRPAVNRWEHRGIITLQRGLHWVEYLHQQDAGSTLARLGWQPPLPDAPGSPLIGQPVPMPDAPAFEVVPGWAMDGRMPCAVEVLRDGQLQLTLLPATGLELRRPRTSVPVIRWMTADREHYRYVGAEGRHWVPIDDARIPVWAWNAHYRSFSMEWEALVSFDGAPVLKTLLYDIELPLTVHVGDRSVGTRLHAMRAWETWPLEHADRSSPFLVALDTVPLLNGHLDSWLAAPRTPIPRPRRAALEHLIEANPLRPEIPLAGSRLASWWRGPVPATIMPDWLSADPWDGDAQVLVRQLDAIPPRSGILIRFDRRVLLQGLTDRQLTTRLHAVMLAIREAGAEPVLVLDSDIDIHHPAIQSVAVAFHRLSLAFGCPFIDKREHAP